MKDQYDIVSKNVGSQNLREVSIFYGGNDFGGGNVNSNTEAHYSFAHEELPIPNKARAEWIRVKDGKRFEKILKVKPLLPKGQFKGKLIFLFDDDDVSFTWKTWEEWYNTSSHPRSRQSH